MTKQERNQTLEFSQNRPKIDNSFKSKRGEIMHKIKKEKMNCDIILTFDKMYDGEKQALMNFDIDVSETDNDLRNFIVNKLFKVVDKKLKSKNSPFEKEWLSNVSTCCDWSVYKRITGNNDLSELCNGKWRFDECDEWKLNNSTSDYELKQKYHFGKNTNNSWYWGNIGKGHDHTTLDYLIYLHKNSGEHHLSNDFTKQKNEIMARQMKNMKSS